MWQKNTGGCPIIQNGRDGYNNSSGTEVTSTEEILEVTTAIRPETTPEVTSITAGNNNRVTWVHNLSKTPLTDVQEKALAHGPNFMVVAREPPVSEYISQIERVCQQLKQGKAEELMGETKLILKNM